MVYYWNLVRSEQPNIHIRLHNVDEFYSTPYVALGKAVWLSCSLEDKYKEDRLYFSRFDVIEKMVYY